MAELEQPRTTGPTSTSMVSGIPTSLVSSNMMPTYTNSNTSYNLAGLTSNVNTHAIGGVTSSTSSYGLIDSTYIGAGGPQSSYSTNVNVSPLPMRANQTNSTMPPLCQVL